MFFSRWVGSRRAFEWVNTKTFIFCEPRLKCATRKGQLATDQPSILLFEWNQCLKILEELILKSKTDGETFFLSLATEIV
jgi:hypothetical protein